MTLHAADWARRVRRRWLMLRARTRSVASLVGRAAWRGWVGFYHGDDLTYAASVAYYGLLSLFPFLLLAFSILGQATADEAHREAVLRFILHYFPTQFEFLARQLDAFRRTRVPIGIGGSLALIWASLGVFGAISSAVNHAWGVEKQRSYLKHKLFSFLMLLAAGVLLLAALLLLSAIQIAQTTWFAGVVERFEGLRVLTSIVLRYATTVMLIVVVGLIFYFVPNAKVRFRDVWAGAIITGLLWRGALQGFSYYLRDMHRFTLVHGSIAAAVVFLFWVYVSAVILLYGVEFTAAYARLRRGQPDEAPAAPSPRT